MSDFSAQPMSKSTEILVVGGGPAGATAAMYTARAGRPTVLLAGRGSAKLGIGYTIENYPGQEPINSLELLEKFRAQARRFGAELVAEEAIDFNLAGPIKYVVTRERLYEAKAVILATGKPLAKERMIPGEERLVGQGVSYCSTCDGPLYRGLDVAAVGATTEAAEEVLALDSLGCRVHWIPDEPKPRSLPDVILEELRRTKVVVHERARVKEVLGEKSVESLLLETDGMQETLAAAALFVFRSSLTSPLFVKSGLKLDHRQCLAVDRQQRTNLEGVFAAGDITCGGMQVVTAAGEGVVAGLQAILYVRKLSQPA
jgi:thioredoxin reductase (NADPH)